jgi:hypothetical protein
MDVVAKTRMDEISVYYYKPLHYNIMILWDVVPCSFIDMLAHCCFGGNWFLHLQIIRTLILTLDPWLFDLMGEGQFREADIGSAKGDKPSS